MVRLITVIQHHDDLHSVTSHVRQGTQTMADSKKLVEQKDDGRELRLAAEHHEFVPTYNDQDLFEFLFTNLTEDFEFVSLEDIVESGKTLSGQIVAAS